MDTGDSRPLATDLLARAQGRLLGQLAGDALGSMVEFQGAEVIQVRYPQGVRAIGPSPVFHTLAGQPTDDSELALALARTLIAAGFVDEQVAAAYGAWRASDPFDVGGTINVATQAIPSIAPSVAPRRCTNRGAVPGQEARASAMRRRM